MIFLNKIGVWIKKRSEDILAVVAPRVCPVCGRVLVSGEQCLCVGCLAGLEYTGYQNIPANPMEQRLERLLGCDIPSMALLVYTHGEVSGRIVSAFKYSGEKELAVYAGRLLGTSVLSSKRFGPFDALVPVPLHPKRLRRRGYNQAEEICRGMVESLGLIVENALIRTVDTRPQASLGRDERLCNAGKVFSIRRGADVRGKSLIVVDDVFTTGATVSGAAQALLDAGAGRVAVACLCAG